MAVFLAASSFNVQAAESKINKEQLNYTFTILKNDTEKRVGSGIAQFGKTVSESHVNIIEYVKECNLPINGEENCVLDKIKEGWTLNLVVTPNKDDTYNVKVDAYFRDLLSLKTINDNSKVQIPETRLIMNKINVAAKLNKEITVGKFEYDDPKNFGKKTTYVFKLILN